MLDTNGYDKLTIVYANIKLVSVDKLMGSGTIFWDIFIMMLITDHIFVCAMENTNKCGKRWPKIRVGKR